LSVELHFHLLPGIDDGPSSTPESVELAAAAVADGTRLVLATPHVHPAHVTDPGAIGERVRELSHRLAAEHVELEVRAGGELSHLMVGRLSQDELDLIAQGPAARRWVLLETPFEGAEKDFAEAANELRESATAVIASDAHGRRAGRMPALSAALAELRRVGHPDPSRHVKSNPRALLTHGLVSRTTDRVA
jgi:protein-tyrosine phosphatase